MLIEYTVRNYRSVAEKTTFSMVPAKGSSKSYNFFQIEKNSNYKKILKSSAIYGANASGKTNLILALNVMKKMVRYSKDMNKGDTFFEYVPFALDTTHSSEPIFLEVKFINKNVQYTYSFSFNATKIVTECLSYFSGKKEIFFFKRDNENFEPQIDHVELKSLFEHTGENVLFLSKANNEYKKFGPVFEWFNKNLATVGPLTNLSEKNTIQFMNESEENKQKVLNFMHFADFDIFDISGQNKKIDDPKFFEILNNLAVSLEIDKKITDKKLNDFEVPELKTVRKRIDGSEIVREFKAFESAGTIQFFKIAGLWLRALQERNQVIIIDEFDLQLHPDLQYYLIKIFQDPDINKTNSQLIFTTHNTRLLATDYFRREQVWFTEKNNESKSTELFSLFDYEKRHDKSIEKGYFLGRYGGLPDIKYGKF